MNTLSSELLLNTFKALDDNRDIVKTRLCCRLWSEIINENQQLWRKIDLLDIHNRWELVVLDLFDRRSQSTLVEISLRASLLSASKVSHLMQLFLRSKETLKTLQLSSCPPSAPRLMASANWRTWMREFADYHTLRTELSGLSCKLPHLQDFRLTSDSPPGRTNVLLHKSNNGIKGRSGFQVLWIISCGDLLTSHLHLLDNLSSLSISSPEPVNWSKILGPCSRRLKHLSILVRLEDEGNPTLQLSSLEVLELREGCSQPGWMITPLTCLVMLQGSTIPAVTPDALRLWTGSLSGWESLARGSPSLEELRIESVHTSGLSTPISAVPMILQRKQNAVAGLEVDGIRMRPLKKLIIPFKDLKPSELQELRELVEEVVDLATVPRLVEVVI